MGFNNSNLANKSIDLRIDVLKMIYRNKAGHIGGDFSAMDIINCLYNSEMNVSLELLDDPDRDRFILSKGHSVEALYAVLADKGFINKQELVDTLSQYGTKFIGHPNKKLLGIEVNSGSLGHGLPVGLGMALAGKLNGQKYYTFVLMGDGELAEGSNWEAFNAAAHFQLDRLIAIIDRNKLQISGDIEKIMSPGDLAAKFASFGWIVYNINGNDTHAICDVIRKAKEGCNNKPSVIIADTVKGYGVSFMEGKREWHHRVPNENEYHMAKEELLTRKRGLQ